jgi:hypothetical protein
VVALPYGSDSDWDKNVRAQDGGDDLRWDEYRVDQSGAGAAWGG